MNQRLEATLQDLEKEKSARILIENEIDYEGNLFVNKIIDRMLEVLEEETQQLEPASYPLEGKFQLIKNRGKNKRARNNRARSSA